MLTFFTRISLALAVASLSLSGCKSKDSCAFGDLSCDLATVLTFPRSLVPKFLYVVNSNASGTISMYSVDERTGVIAALSPSSVPYGNTGAIMNLDPGRNFAFVDDVGANVYTFAINQVTGQLTQTATTVSLNNSNSFVVEPRGKFAYGANNGSTTINIYSYNQGTGAVTLINSATNTGATATQSSLIDSTGRFLYTSNQTSNNVSQFSIDSNTGALGSLGAAIGATQPGSLCMDSQNRWLYAPNTGGATVASFAIAANGSLSSTGNPGVASTNAACIVTPDSAFMILSGTTFMVMPINQTTGVLGSAASYFSGGGMASIDPSGNFLFNADAGNVVRSFRINKSTGALTQISSVSTGTTPGSAALVNLYSF